MSSEKPGEKRKSDFSEDDINESGKISRTIQYSDDDSESDMEDLERQMLESREEDEEEKQITREDEEEKQIATEVEKIMKIREELLPKRLIRPVENENPIISIFLDISSHGSSSIFTNCKGKRTGFDPSTWNVVMLKPPQERGGGNESC